MLFGKILGVRLFGHCGITVNRANTVLNQSPKIKFYIHVTNVQMSNESETESIKFQPKFDMFLKHNEGQRFADNAIKSIFTHYSFMSDIENREKLQITHQILMKEHLSGCLLNVKNSFHTVSR